MIQTESPVMLADICGSADVGDLAPIQALIAPNVGILPRGTILSSTPAWASATVFTAGQQAVSGGKVCTAPASPAWTQLSAPANNGVLTPTVAGNEITAYGILLERDVDTSIANSDSTVTGAVARNGSFKAAALTCGIGADVGEITAVLRDNGIILEGILVPGLVTVSP
jgi:hypothetical protein